jgi:selenocysteine lyase/cysteine desulfurase
VRSSAGPQAGSIGSVQDTEAVIARLRDAGVVAAVRAGRVRLSVHFYNLEEEIDRAAGLLADA